MRLFIIPLLFASLNLHAAEFSNSLGAFYLDPHVGIGASTLGGTTVLAGLDLGYMITDQISVGVGGFGQFGEKPSRDRALGFGPFAQFIQPLTPFLTFSAREDLDYVDVRRPYADTYDTVTGIASFTTLALHLKLANFFGVSGGYRAALGLNDPDLGKGRSMPFVGFSIGI